MVRREDDGTVCVDDETSLRKIKSYKKMKEVFEEEAQNIVTINTVPHKNVAGFVSLEREVNNTVYYLMPYSQGEELGDYLKRVESENKRLNQQEIMALVEPILSGLTHIHGYGVYHKDIKPANIYIRKNDEPLLIDFGASVTSAHMLTPTYAPIEQVKRIVSEYGAYTDLYAVGVMMYEMIVGRKPPKSQERAETISRGERDPYALLVKNREISKKFEKHFLVAIDHALELGYRDRPQTAKLFKEELRGDLKRKKRNRLLLLTLFSAVFLFVSVYLIYEKQRVKYGYLIVPNNEHAQVLVDNRRVEVDRENRYPILLGKHSVEVKNSMGYLSSIDEVEFKEENEQHRVDNELIKEQVLFELRTKENLVAQVELNGEFIGNTPYVGKLFYNKIDGGIEKKYSIVLKKVGYADSLEKQFLYKELMREKGFKINVELRKKEGFVEIKSPVGFKIKVNGRLLRNSDGEIELTPITFKKVPGKYTIYLYSSKRELVGKNKIKVYKPILREVTVSDKETTLFPQIKAKKSPQYIIAKKREVKKVEKKKKTSFQEILKIPKQPNMSKPINGVRFAKTEVTYDELVRFLNSASLSDVELKRYFYRGTNSVAKYIKKEINNYYVYKGYEQYPVVQISWHGAKAYMEWLNEKTNVTYRLPTYSEWQTIANFNPFNLSSTLSAVEKGLVNSLGMFHVYGNVAEWSEDAFGEYSRITLGGSFNTRQEYMNSLVQNSMNENSTKNSDIGFRLVQ
jgi:serine/threonine protein kinase